MWLTTVTQCLGKALGENKNQWHLVYGCLLREQYGSLQKLVLDNIAMVWVLRCFFFFVCRFLLWKISNWPMNEDISFGNDRHYQPQNERKKTPKARKTQKSKKSKKTKKTQKTKKTKK